MRTASDLKNVVNMANKRSKRRTFRQMSEFFELDRDIRGCIRCAGLLAPHPEDPPAVLTSVTPKPVVSRLMRAPVMLVGQAPGLTEYRTEQPFSGQAGREVRKLFAEAGLHPSKFDEVVYQTSAVKCFPGRKQNGEKWEDRPPCSAMLGNCSDFLGRQIRVVRPEIIVLLGLIAIKCFDKLLKRPSTRRLSDVVGTSEIWVGIRIVYLAHTSGGSRWHNKLENKAKQTRGKAILGSCLASLQGGLKSSIEAR